MKIGYVRVSKNEQNEALQVDALKEAGCTKWFVDKISGSKVERKGLNEALAYVREGGYSRMCLLGRSKLIAERKRMTKPLGRKVRRL